MQVLLLFLSLSLVSGLERTDSTPAIVKIYHERSIESSLIASVEAFGKIYRLSLNRIEISTVRLSELVIVNGTLVVQNIPGHDNVTKYFHDKYTGSVLFLNEKDSLEGILTDDVVLKHQNDQYFAFKIQRESSERFFATPDHVTRNVLSPESENKYESFGSDNQTKEKPSYTAEILTVIDSTLANHLGNDYYIHKYMSVYWYMVNQRFTYVSTATIQLRLSDIIISRTTAVDNFIQVPLGSSSTLVNIVSTLYKFSGTIRSLLSSLPKHDLAHFITKKDLASGSSTSYLGIAFVASACYYTNTTAYYTGVSEDDGYYKGMMTTVHEIAHNLGAPHDGYSTSSSCPWSNGYMMSYLRNSYKTFYFSSCSQDAMRDIYYKSYTGCLKKITGPYNYLSSSVPGLQMTLNEQCRQRTGFSNAYLHPSYSPSSHCVRLRCVYKNGTTTYSYDSFYPALEGSRCKTGGFCSQGACRNYYG